MPQTILVIEDNRDNFEMVRFLLEQEGFAVLGAYDGREGLSKAQTEKPALILLDLTLPEIDGWTLAAQLKTDPLTQAIPILALTAHALPGDRKKAMDAGCDGYITKPLDLNEFIVIIKQTLNK